MLKIWAVVIWSCDCDLKNWWFIDEDISIDEEKELKL